MSISEDKKAAIWVIRPYLNEHQIGNRDAKIGEKEKGK
jgi:hypothetical protein